MTEFTWATLILVGGLAVLALAQFAMKKADKRKMWTWAGIIAGGIGIFAMFIIPVQLSFLNQPVSFGGGTQVQVITTEDGGTGGGVSGCAEDTTTTFSIESVSDGSSLGGYHRYSVNGAPWLTLADASTATLSPGDSVDVLFGFANTSHYFGSYKQGLKVPCAGTATFSDKVYQNGTSLTFVVLNEEGTITTTTAETLGAGDVASLDISLKGSFEAGYPYGGVIVAEYGKDVYDKIIFDIPGGKSTSTPQYHTPHNTSYVLESYEVPAIIGTQKLEGVITLDTDDNTNPAGSSTGTGGNITLFFYPDNYFINEDEGGIVDGPAPEDEDKVPTFIPGTTHFNSTIYTINVA